MMHNSNDINNYLGCLSSFVGIFKLLSYDSDSKSTSFLNTAVHKLPPIMKESWSLFLSKKHWEKPTPLVFQDWLLECPVFKEKTSTQRAKVIAEGKLCFSCLSDKHMFWKNSSPVNVDKMAAAAPITPCSTELKGFFRLNPQLTTSILWSQV